MRLGPGASFRILKYASPDRIDQGYGGIEGLLGALSAISSPASARDDCIVHAVGVDEFLGVAPAAELVVIGLVVNFGQGPRAAPW